MKDSSAYTCEESRYNVTICSQQCAAIVKMLLEKGNDIEREESQWCCELLRTGMMP